MATTFQVTFDAADPVALAEFWATVLGYVVQPPPEGYATWDAFLDDIGVPEDQRDVASAIVDPDGVGPRVFFQKVPEAKIGKNRVHLDVNVGGGRDVGEAERRRRVADGVERLVAAGASRLREVEERGEYWVVMADPEGNEFCLQ